MRVWLLDGVTGVRCCAKKKKSDSATVDVQRNRQSIKDTTLRPPAIERKRRKEGHGNVVHASS
jgi:hypothetical protein